MGVLLDETLLFEYHLVEPSKSLQYPSMKLFSSVQGHLLPFDVPETFSVRNSVILGIWVLQGNFPLFSLIEFYT